MITAQASFWRKIWGQCERGRDHSCLYASHEELFGPAVEKFLASCTLGKQMPEPEPLIFARISDAGVEEGPLRKKIHKCSEKST